MAKLPITNLMDAVRQKTLFDSSTSNRQNKIRKWLFNRLFETFYPRQTSKWTKMRFIISDIATYKIQMVEKGKG